MLALVSRAQRAGAPLLAVSAAATCAPRAVAPLAAPSSASPALRGGAGAPSWSPAAQAPRRHMGIMEGLSKLWNGGKGASDNKQGACPTHHFCALPPRKHP